VQVDETKVNFNCKSHRGRSGTSQIWAISIVDTSTSPARGYIEIVPNRSRETLIAIIKKVVREGSVIHTDEWKGYIGLRRSNYEHKTICHKYHFVELETGVHTQHVESFNNKVKSKIKEAKGCLSTCHDRFFTEFLWFEHNKENCLSKLMELIKV
jgi:hypothetical protein